MDRLEERNMRDFSGFLFFSQLRDWWAIIALCCYWSTILKQGGIGFWSLEEPPPLTRCSVSGLDAMLLHYIVQDFWTGRQ